MDYTLAERNLTLPPGRNLMGARYRAQADRTGYFHEPETIRPVFAATERGMEYPCIQAISYRQ
jgi:hypothetical protein